MVSRPIQKELGAQLCNALRMKGLELRVVGPQPMPSHPAVMEEAGRDPQGNKIVAIMAQSRMTCVTSGFKRWSGSRVIRGGCR